MVPREAALEVIGSAEIYFAKKLANNDKKIREKALKKLQIWLVSKAKLPDGIDQDECLKIWKGLFYCMWYSDKPLVQEELADNLSRIIYSFKDDHHTGLLFSKVFFETMGREWLGIDRLRIDKFYMLIRKSLFTTLDYIASPEWNTEMLDDFTDFLKTKLVSDKYADGMKIYICEKFVDQMQALFEQNEKVNFPSQEQFLVLVEPFLQAIAFTQSQSVFKTIQEEILDVLYTFKILRSDESGKKKKFQVPFNEIATRLCELGADKSVTTKNRKLLYLYTDKYRKHVELLQARKDAPRKRKRKSKKIESDETNIEKEVTQGIVEEGVKPKKRKKNKDLKTKEIQTETDKKNNEITKIESDLQKPKQKKKKNKVKETANIENSEECTQLEVKKLKKKKVKKTISEETRETETKSDGTAKEIKKSNKKKKRESFVTVDNDIEKNISQLISSTSDKSTVDESTADKNTVDESTIEETSKEVKKSNKKKRKSSKVEFDLEKSISRLINGGESDEEVSFPKLNETIENVNVEEGVATEETDILQGIKQKLDFSDDDEISMNVSTTPLHSKVDEKVLTAESKKKRKKKDRKSLKSCDQPQPISFVKTPPPGSFFRKAAMKSEPPKHQNKTKSKLAVTTANTDPAKKKVRIELSNNKSISHKDLKIDPSPTAAFSPNRKPIKSAIKTPSSHGRPKAKDFF